MKGHPSLHSALPPLDAEGVLWVAAIDRVPVEERIEWVKTKLAAVERINAERANPHCDERSQSDYEAFGG